MLSAFRSSLLQLFKRYTALRAISLTVVGVLCLHFILSKFNGIFLVNGIAGYWPVCGILVAVLLLNRRSLWPWIMLGFILVDISTEPGPAIVRAIEVAGNIMEILIPAFFLPACVTLDSWTQERAIIRRFTIYGLLLGPISCSIPISLYHHLALHEGFWGFLVRWTVGDTLGMALAVPLVLTLCSRQTYQLFRRDALLETAIVMSSVCVASWAIFYHASFSVEFMMLPVLLLVAFRLGLSGSVIAVNLVALIASLATLNALGPFQLGLEMREQDSIVLLRIFLIVSMMMCLPVSLALLERNRFEQRLSDAYARLNLVTISDALTGIANRRCFDQTIDKEWRRAIRDCSEVSLLMIDVDEFKHFNDTNGHVEGDECLRRVAAAISSVPARETDLVARYGGEEFAVVMPGTNLVGAQPMANLIRIAVESMQLSHPGSKHGKVTVSIGYSVERPAIGTEPSSLISSADRALYKAKQRGRNCVVSSSTGDYSSGAHQPS